MASSVNKTYHIIRSKSKAGGYKLNYKEILDQLYEGKLDKYEVEPKNAYEFQKELRSYGKRQAISGRAVRGGNIIYSRIKGDD